MPDRTLWSRSTRSAVFVVQEELRNLRQHVADPSPDWTRIAASAHALSSSLKRLSRFLDYHDTTPEQRRAVEPPRTNIDTILNAVEAVRFARVCCVCEGLLPEPEGAPEATATPVDEESRAGAMTAVRRAENGDRR